MSSSPFDLTSLPSRLLCVTLSLSPAVGRGRNARILTVSGPVEVRRSRCGIASTAAVAVAAVAAVAAAVVLNEHDPPVRPTSRNSQPAKKNAKPVKVKYVVSLSSSGRMEGGMDISDVCVRC